MTEEVKQKLTKKETEQLLVACQQKIRILEAKIKDLENKKKGIFGTGNNPRVS